MSLPTGGLPPKISDFIKSALINEAIKRPRITLKELKRFTAQMGENLSWQPETSQTLHTCGGKKNDLVH